MPPEIVEGQSLAKEFNRTLKQRDHGGIFTKQRRALVYEP